MRKINVLSIKALGLVAILTTLGACSSSDGQPAIPPDTDQQNKPSTNPSSQNIQIFISATPDEAHIKKYEDGIFKEDKFGTLHCDGYGGLKAGERCGLLSFTITGTLNELLKVSADKAVSVDYQLSSNIGNVGDILQQPNLAQGTVKLDKNHIQSKLDFKLKSDEKVTPNRKVTLTLKNPKNGADLSKLNQSLLTVDILDAQQAAAQSRKINDTGVLFSANAAGLGNDKTCKAEHPSQDCNHGADKGGKAGFSFTKLDATGQKLADDATSWQCVKDNITGLVWERKTFALEESKQDFRDSKWDYAYYDASQKLGNETVTGYCKLSNCTTAAYTAKLNADKLCGIDTWRLPTRLEFFDVLNLNNREGIDVLHTHLLMSIDTVPAPLEESNKPEGSTLPDSDYVDQTYKRVRSAFWTSSVASKYDTPPGKYSEPRSVQFRFIWKMLPDGISAAEDASTQWNTNAILAVATPKPANP